MWSLYYPCLMMLLAFPIAMAGDIEEDLQKCVRIVDFEDLEKVLELPDSQELDIICPPMLDFIGCLEEVLYEKTGFRVDELEMFMQGTNIGRFFSVYVNVRNLFVELCDKDTQLHKDYQENSACYKNVTIDGYAHPCNAKAEDILDDLKSSEEQKEAEEDEVEEEAGEGQMPEESGENNVQEEDRQEAPFSNHQCKVEAFRVACAAIQIHEECGQRAFNLFMQIVRRTTFFRNGICTADQLKDAKIHFMESLDTNHSHKELYELAFDMKKRRK